MARNRQKAKQRKAKADAAAAKSGVPASGAPDPVGAPPSDEGTVKAAASVEATEEIKRTAKLKPEAAKSQPKKDKPVKEKGRLRTFLRSSWAELRRVQWPDRKQMSTMTTIVIGFVILAGAYLGAIDFVANKIVDFLVF